MSKEEKEIKNNETSSEPEVTSEKPKKEKPKKEKKPFNTRKLKYGSISVAITAVFIAAVVLPYPADAGERADVDVGEVGYFEAVQIGGQLRQEQLHGMQFGYGGAFEQSESRSAQGKERCAQQAGRRLDAALQEGAAACKRGIV